jgi:hypothetical protein
VPFAFGAPPFLRAPGAAYAHESTSPRLMQLSHGCALLHFNFLCLQGPHDNGILLRLRTTLNWPSGDWPLLDVFEDGGVGVMVVVVCVRACVCMSVELSCPYLRWVRVRIAGKTWRCRYRCRWRPVVKNQITIVREGEENFSSRF